MLPSLGGDWPSILLKLGVFYILISQPAYIKYCSGIATFLYLLIANVFIPGFISPLAKIPNAHWSSAYTDTWIKLKEANGGTGLQDVLKAHKKYGPIVRVSPRTLSICSLDSLRQAYSGGFDKTTFYNEFTNYNVPNLVSTIHNRPHSIQKRMISNVYSKSYIQKSEDFDTLSKVMLYDRLFPTLLAAARTNDDVDAYGLNQALGADFMNAYLFGTRNGTNLIQDVVSRNEIILALKIKLRKTPKKVASNAMFDRHLLSMCEAAGGIAPPPYNIMTSLPSTKAVVYGQIMSKLAKETLTSGIPPRLIAASEMMDQNIAAIETFKVALTYTQWELSRKPDLVTRLQAELSTLSPSLRYDPSAATPPALPDPKDLDALPFLNAILKEILRLYTPSPGMFPRAVPREGVVMDGRYIPGGTTVAAAAYCLHRNEAVYPEAENFMPERWLAGNSNGVDGSPGGRTEQERWYWPFGSGGRMCIGSHFAIQGKCSLKPGVKLSSPVLCVAIEVTLLISL